MPVKKPFSWYKVIKHIPRIYPERVHTSKISDHFDVAEVINNSQLPFKDTVRWLSNNLGIPIEELKLYLDKEWFPKPNSINTKFSKYERWQTELILDAFDYARNEAELLELKGRPNFNKLLRNYLELNEEVYKNHEFVDV